MLSHKDTLFPSDRWVIQVTCLSSSPRALRHRAEVHFHHGSREMQARLYFADRDKLQPGESCLCDVHFSEPVPAVFGDRCVIRSFSPLRTVAGGVVLNPLGVDMRRRSAGFAERCRMLSSLGAASEEERAFIQLACTGGADAGIAFSRLRVLTNSDSKALDKALSALSNKQRVFCFDKEQRLYMAEHLVNALAVACEASVTAHHKRYSEKQGMKRGELASTWGKGLSAKLIHFVLERLIKQGKLVAETEYLRLPDHAAAFNKEQAPLGEALLAAYKDAGLSPPNSNELLEALKISKKEAAPVLAALRASGQLVRVAEGVWYAAEHLAAAEATLRKWFETHDSIDVGGLREATGLSRKYLVALLEYFDAQKLTIRVGDKRILRKP